MRDVAWGDRRLVVAAKFKHLAVAAAIALAAASGGAGLALGRALPRQPPAPRSGAAIMVPGRVYNCDPGNEVTFERDCGRTLMVCRAER